MNEALHVRRLHARYRLAPADRERAPALDALLGRAVSESLESALARRGVLGHEEICIRSVQAPVRLRLGDGEAAAASAWAEAIADAIAARLAAGSPDVVRYRTVRAALADLALGVATGRLERVWAWRRLGLWRGGDLPGDRAASAELVAALAREPEAIAPVLAGVARAGALERLLATIPAADWTALATRALAAADASAAVLDAAHASAAALDTALTSTATGAATAAAELARALAATGGSTVALEAALASAAARAPVGALDAALASAAAALLAAALEARLGSGATGSGMATAAALREHAARVIRASALAGPAAARRRAPALTAALAVLAALDAEPAVLVTRPGSAAGALAAAIAAELTVAAATSLPSEPARHAVAANAGDAAASKPEPAPEPEPRHLTSYGGMLFLLAALDALELPAELAAGPRPLPWTLHLLALALVPVEPDDPAALAFAGLAPDAEPPTLTDPPDVPDLAAASALARRLAEHLAERLDHPDAAPEEVLEFVCRRRGEIIFAPGWIELRLPPDQVSVELRRAGLDLDPGWLPWLGAVLRFVYA